MTSPIQVRDLRFSLQAVPRDWHARGVAVTAYYDQLSLFFPVGEAFFVRSVRHFVPQLPKGPQREAVAAFCAQEGHHGREHLAYNRRLAEGGVPVAPFERAVRFLLGTAQRFLSPRRQLAITCVLEHLTSLMGELVLARPALLEGSDPTMTALWRWHSAEECEHRGVAFDVFTAAGGTWLERCRAMLVSSLFFWTLVVVQQLTFMWKRGVLFAPTEHWRLFRYLFLDPSALGALVVPWCSYFRRDFHPAQRGGDALLEAWRRGSQLSA